MKEKIKSIKNRSRNPPETDYTKYTFTTKEIIYHLALKLLFMAMVARLFYDSIIAWVLLLPIAVWSFKQTTEELCKKRKRRLELEFREMILSVSSNMQAGYSVENAFNEAYKEIVVLYGKDSIMAVELRLMLRKVSNNIQIEEALMNLARRSGVQDIRDFADIFQIAKRGGGDMRGIISDTADIIGGKQDVRREIDTVVSEKKFENTIMRYIPFFIIFYISLTSKGYFETMYHNIFGWIIMTISFVVYIISCRMSDRILDITL
jgi:tight adherence protein B